MKKLVKESLQDRLFEEMETDTIIVKVRKGSGENMKNIIECIKDCGNTGHTYSIVIDPDEKEGLSERTFEWDGDGSDHVESVTLKEGE
jgi:hypothetical protein